MLEEFRKYLFSEIEKKINANTLLAEELALLWNIGKSTAYKKISGETAVSVEEVLLAARKLGISIDDFTTGYSERVMMRYPPLSGHLDTPVHFLNKLLDMMARMGTAPDFKIQYATNEIPVFYYLLFPELTVFKMFIWSQAVWGTVEPKMKDVDVIHELTENETLHDLRKKAFDAYASAPSFEVYPLNILDNTLNQIRYASETGSIDAVFKDKLMAQLSDLVHWLETASEEGRKRSVDGSPQAALEVHYNEIIYTNNLILASNAHNSMVFTTFDNPNYLVCNDERLIRHAEQWFEKVRHKSIRISKDNERHRRMFYNELARRVFELNRKIY